MSRHFFLLFWSASLLEGHYEAASVDRTNDDTKNVRDDVNASIDSYLQNRESIEQQLVGSAQVAPNKQHKLSIDAVTCLEKGLRVIFTSAAPSQSQFNKNDAPIMVHLFCPYFGNPNFNPASNPSKNGTPTAFQLFSRYFGNPNFRSKCWPFSFPE